MSVWKARDGIDIPPEHVEQLFAEARHRRARENIDTADLLAQTMGLMLDVPRDHLNPLWSLVKHCKKFGTLRESGRMPPMTAQVGELVLPFIDKALALLLENAWD